MSRKPFYYVGVQTEKGIIFVTSFNYSTKSCFWNIKDKPLSMSHAVAKDIAEGLCMNLTVAFVIETFIELEWQPISEKEGE